jgi:transposase
LLAEWLIERDVEEVVMESTAQYWKPVWAALERYRKPIRQKRKDTGPSSGTLHLAQAQLNRGRHGRKKDFPDAERLVERLVADELILSFVPNVEQRLWRTVTRRKHQLTRNHVRLQNQLESLLEDQQMAKLDQEIASLLTPHHDAVKRLSEVPGLGVDSAQQIIAEVGATAATFPRGKNLVSWVGAMSRG